MFQGQEQDDDKGKGNSINYKYRVHDPRTGRFYLVDPLFRTYPHNSSYAFSENRVIDGVELEGLEVFLIHGTRQNNSDLYDDNTVNQFKRIGGNTAVDKSFSWGEYSQINNSRNGKRKKAAIKLVRHVLETRGNMLENGEITDDEPITLVGYSHGGNVSLQAAAIIEAEGHGQVNLITVATPAYNDGSTEDPTNNKGIKKHVHIYSEGDSIDALARGNETYQNKKTQNLKIGEEYIPHKGGYDTHSSMGNKEKSLGIGKFLQKVLSKINK